MIVYNSLSHQRAEVGSFVEAEALLKKGFGNHDFVRVDGLHIGAGNGFNRGLRCHLPNGKDHRVASHTWHDQDGHSCSLVTGETTWQKQPLPQGTLVYSVDTEHEGEWFIGIVGMVPARLPGTNLWVHPDGVTTLETGEVVRSRHLLSPDSI